MAKMNERGLDSRKKSKKLGQKIEIYTDTNLYNLSESGFSQDLQQGGKRILDLCCGKGMATKPFSGASNELFYLDLSKEMINAGMREGYIKGPNCQMIVDRAENIIKNEQLAPLIGSFDAIIVRFAFHDFTQQKHDLFHTDRASFYRGSIDYQREMLGKIYKTLRGGGELQIIDMVVPAGKSSVVKELYNKYHMLKTTGDPISVHIPTERELEKMAKEQNFKLENKAWHTSELNLVDWFREGQITKDKLKRLRLLFRRASKNKELAETFRIRVGKKISVAFPLVVATFLKPT